MPQEAVEKPEEPEFTPYEDAGISEIPERGPEEKNISEPIIVDNEQDAGIVLEAAEEILKQEEKMEETAEAVSEPDEKEEQISEEVVEERDTSDDIAEDSKIE